MTLNLDYLVATKVMGWVEGSELWHDKKTGMPTRIPLGDWQPTKSISQTFEVVVEKMRKEGYELWLSNEGSFSELLEQARARGWKAEFTHVDTLAVGYGQSPAEAICKAALRVVGWVEEEVLFFKSDIPMERYEIKKALEVIRRDPENPSAHYDLGMVYSKRGRFFQAQEAFDKAIFLKPNYHEAHAELGWVYYQLKQIPEAIEEYQTALNIEAGSAKAHFGLGLSYIALGDRAFALREHKILLELDQELANKLFSSIHE